MFRVKRLIHEIHRRSLWQVLAIYLGGAWIGFEVVQTLTEGLGLPDWFPAFALVLFIVFLPLVLAAAFVQEGVAGDAPQRRLLLVLVVYVLAAWVGFLLVATLSSRLNLPDWLPGLAGFLLVVLLPAVLWTAFVREGPGEELGELQRPEATGVRRSLSWRNVLAAAVAAFALLGVAVTGHMAMRVMGIGPVGTLIAKGVIQAHDRIMLADFDDHAGDSILALTITEALRVDLSQSGVVSLAEPEYVANVLKRMERDPHARFSAELAQEAAIREGLKAVLAGAVHAAGTDYVLSIQLVAAETGNTLWAGREVADEASLSRAIDRISSKLRTRVGESLKAVRASEPLAQVTTHSLEALRKYSQAERTTDNSEAIALLKGAVELDSSFALAHAALGTRYYWSNDRPSGEAHFDKAQRQADRLTERERLWLAAQVPAFRGNREEAIRHYKVLLNRYPDHIAGWDNLGHAYLMLGRCDEALEAFASALELDPFAANVHLNAATCYGTLRRPDEAISSYLKAFELQPDLQMTGNLNHEFGFTYVEAGDLQAAEETFRKMLAGEDWQKARGHRSLALLYMYLGRHADAIDNLKRAILYNKAAGAKLSELRDRLYLAVAYGAKGLLREYNEQLDAVNGIRQQAYVEPGFLLYAGKLCLKAGKTDLASELLDEISARMNEDNRWDEAAFNTLKGELELARGYHGDAISLFEYANVLVDNNYFLESLARAHLSNGELDQALAEYEKLVGRPQLGWEGQEYWILAHYRLGGIYEQKGDLEKAADYYERFSAIWKAGDDDLIDLQDAKRNLARLSSALRKYE